MTFSGHEWLRAKWSAPVRRYWKISEQLMIKYCDLANLIDKTDAMDESEIKSLGHKAKKRVADEYTWEKICGMYEQLFLGK